MSPFVMVIFGATGDLARNKLFPALYSLFEKNLIPDTFYIVGFSRRSFSDEEFREEIKQTSSVGQKDRYDEFAKNIYYEQGVFGEEAGYYDLIERLQQFDEKMGACIMRFFYLATPPQFYETILANLKRTKLSEGCGQESNKWTRLAIEKPFGNNLETAKQLDRTLADIFDEKQIFRVDHYLAKETVQNILAFRFANGIFEPVWNSEYVDHVQITFAETQGVEGRGGFFDGVGILRDVMQNHLMQLVASVVMEQPQSFTKDVIRDTRAKAVGSIQCIDPEEVSDHVVSGQYDGYKETEEVAPDSKTETFVAMKFFVRSPRFDGVPFYMRAGKEMPENSVTISLVFKQTCHLLFKEYGCPEIGNVLTIHIQPNEGITMRVIAKKPGQNLSLGMVNMDFSYSEEFGDTFTKAYEKLLLDIFNDDQTLFSRSDELESSWQFITTIMEGWKRSQTVPASYPQGMWGPKASQELIERDGRKWL